MMNKKRTIWTIAIAAMAVVVSANVVTAIQQEKDVQAWGSLMDGDFESLASGENGDEPIYYGAVNSYCVNPAGGKGCVKSNNMGDACTLGIFCIDPTEVGVH